MKTITSWDYIRDNFDPQDRLAIVIKFQQQGLVQRIATAEKLALPRFQAWLRRANAHGGDVYISANALRPESTSRTRADVHHIRHVYLDIDHNGPAVVEKLLNDPRIPKANYLLNTSPGKFQMLWKVQNFSMAQAEALQRAMAAEFGADRAVVDAARVLRIPGLYNKKYPQLHQVTAQRLSNEVYRPSDFHIAIEIEKESPQQIQPKPLASRPEGRISQSERDWAETLQRLKCGEDPAVVQAALEQKRQDKHRPSYYAARTVTRALAELARRHSREPEFEL